jgi:hypothetical protein
LCKDENPETLPALYDLSGAVKPSAEYTSPADSGTSGFSYVGSTEFLWTGGADEAFVAKMTSLVVRQPDLTASSPTVVQGLAVRHRFLCATADVVQNAVSSVRGAGLRASGAAERLPPVLVASFAEGSSTNFRSLRRAHVYPFPIRVGPANRNAYRYEVQKSV